MYSDPDHRVHRRSTPAVPRATAKYEEPEELVPSVSDLNVGLNYAYAPDLIQQMEVLVLTK